MIVEKKISNSHQKWLVLLSVAMFTFMATLDGSIINVALPTIAKSFDVKMNQTIWIVSVYLVTICIFLLLFGKIGDMVGKVKVFKIGTIVFVLGSFLCGIKINLAFLLFARVIQAIGASMTMSTNFGIITETFPYEQRGKALGILGSFVSLGSIAGPGIGGLLLSRFDWSYIFWINIPVGIAAIILGALYLNQDHEVKMEALDLKGFSVYAFAVFFFFIMIFYGQEVGFFRYDILTLFIVTILLVLLFIKIEKQAINPLIDLKIFSNSLFSIGIICAFLVFTANSFFTVIMPFYLQETLSLTPSSAGFLLMIISFVMMFATPISGTLSDKVGREILTFIGLIILAIGQITLSMLSQTTTLNFFIVIAVMLGLGNALFQSPNNAIVMSSVPKHELGMAGGLNSLARNLGMICGIALSTTTLYTTMSFRSLQKITSYPSYNHDLFIYGLHYTFLLAFLIVFFATCLTGYRYVKKK